MKPLPIQLFPVGLLTAIMLGGCSSMGASGQTGSIKLATDPAGATAYADGSELGTTPFDIVPGQHFRSGFVGLSYRYYGKLSFKKPGCDTLSLDVDDHMLSKDVHAKLKCDPDYHPPVATSAAQTTSVAASYAERLERIETLHRKNLINDKEYKNLRQRILDEL